jgi:hypothetical protein
MKIYAVGGMGINVGKQFVKYDGKEAEGFATIETVFIDTSKSNVGQDIPEKNLYLVEGLDGSGKVRASNYQALVDCSKDILLKHRPGNVNVLLHSAGGGSGSTASPVLASELLARGELVIVACTGSTSSRIETENTLKTLKSYEAIAQKRETPLICIYRENNSEKPRSVVDAELQQMVIILAAIFSGQNKELDQSDLRNFLNYHKVTSYPAKLSQLEIFTHGINLPKGHTLVSLATLFNEKTSPEVELHPEYQATGWIHPEAEAALNVALPVHAAVISGHFNGVAERLTKRLESFDEVRKTIVEKSILGKDASSAEDDGVIL